MTNNNKVSHSDGQNREELGKILERINFWISNCDTKISFALAFAGVLLAGFFSSSIITGSLNTLIEKTAKINIASFWEVVVLIVCTLVLIVFIICTVVAVTYLFKALKGAIDTSVYKESGLTSDSLIFFGTIANQTFQAFKDKTNTSDDNKMKNDLLSQIYINSKNCDNKFKLYNIGVNLLIISVILFVLLNILFLFI